MSTTVYRSIKHKIFYINGKMYHVHIMKLKSYNGVYRYYLQADLHLLLKTE